MRLAGSPTQRSSDSFPPAIQGNSQCWLGVFYPPPLTPTHAALSYLCFASPVVLPGYGAAANVLIEHGNATATLCAANTFRSGTALYGGAEMACQPCPTGMRTYGSAIGSTSSDACLVPPGWGWNSATQTAAPCPVGQVGRDTRTIVWRRSSSACLGAAVRPHARVGPSDTTARERQPTLFGCTRTRPQTTVLRRLEPQPVQVVRLQRWHNHDRRQWQHLA